MIGCWFLGRFMLSNTDHQSVQCRMPKEYKRPCRLWCRCLVKKSDMTSYKCHSSYHKIVEHDIERVKFVCKECQPSCFSRRMCKCHVLEFIVGANNLISRILVLLFVSLLMNSSFCTFVVIWLFYFFFISGQTSSTNEFHVHLK